VLPIVTCTVDGKCLPVLQASVKAYAPDVPHLIFSPKLDTSAKSYDFALQIAFQTYDEVIVCADDLVLTPYSYQTLIDDINALKEKHGDKLGIVAAHTDFTRYTQNIRYQQSPTDKLEYGKWSWEHECRPVKRLSPIFHYLSKKTYEACGLPPIEWYSDDVWCEDLNALGYHHYISRCYVHHAGSQTLGQNTQKLHDEAMPWLIKNRPQYLDLFFGEGARKKMEKKLKIAVYTITKNEEQFIERWAQSAKDADLLLIADTGSTDRTAEIAKENGVQVHDICVTPWRFDHARNTSLMLIPKDYDVCICLDADEVMEPGWREEIERVWTPETTHLRYKFDWSLGIVFYSEKIHARHGYYWHHPCHEHIRADLRITEVWAHTDFLLITHHPDPTKSRGHYMETLELSVKEDPHCPRNAFYYARELYFHNRYQDAIEALDRYLKMPEAVWINDRCYAMRVTGQCHEALGDQAGAEAWYHKAAAEAPHTREPWVALAKLYYEQHKWAESYGAATRALSIKNRELVYTSEPASWGPLPHDYAAIAAYRMGLGDVAIEQGTLACELDPEDPRLRENLLWYKGEKE
jgi:glycosyltransferase involved in cell wall biosynthesis